MSPSVPFGRTTEIRRPPIAAINALAAREAARGRDIVDLGQAVLGMPPPASAMDAVLAYLAKTPVQRYSPDPGLDEVREAVAGYLRQSKGIAGARAEQVMLTCGANQAFVDAIFTLTRPGDEVITFGPGYFDHDFAIRLAQAKSVEVGLEVVGPPAAPGGFRFDIAAVERAITPRTRAVVLVSPGNPTGAVIDSGALEALVSLCRSRGLWLLSDETYDLLTFPPARSRSPATATSPAAVSARDRIVVLGSFSKVFALAAWRVGYLFGPADLVQEAIKAQDALVVCAPVPAQHAAAGALREAEPYAAEARRVLKARRDILLSRLDGHPLLAPVPPQGATFVMARLRRGGDDVGFCQRLVQDAGVVAVPGSAFGARGAGWVRLSFGNQPKERLLEACNRIDQLARSSD